MHEGQREPEKESLYKQVYLSHLGELDFLLGIDLFVFKEIAGLYEEDVEGQDHLKTEDGHVEVKGFYREKY